MNVNGQKARHVKLNIARELHHDCMLEFTWKMATKILAMDVATLFISLKKYELSLIVYNIFPP